MSEQIKNKLWSVVENSNGYSFENNPLPIFHMFGLFAYNFYKNGNEGKWGSLFNEFMESFDFYKENGELFDTFRNQIVTVLQKDKEQFEEIVDFFTEKYLMQHSKFKSLPIMTDELLDFVYWYAIGEEGDTLDAPIYNPYAGLTSIGSKHAKTINIQFEHDLEHPNDWFDISEIKELYKDNSWYQGVESDPVLRFIANLRLLLSSPTNCEQMYIAEGDSLNDDISDYTGRWIFITIPPLESYKKASEADVKLISTLIDKFIDAKGMHDGYFLLPKIFCYDESYQYIRRELIFRRSLASVIEIPQDAFKSPVDAVLIHLRKSDYVCGTNLTDARQFLKEGKLDDSALLKVCLFDETSEYSKMFGDYTFSQCNYCILPSMYLQSENELLNDKDLKDCYIKYQTFIESQIKSEKKRIAHRNISGQLSHMLGATYHKIYDAITELKYVEGMEDKYSMLYDNFKYMERLINSIDDDFSSQKMNLEEITVNEYLLKYCKAWKNYGKKLFSVSFESELKDDTSFKIDDVFMKVMLDAILENANRHGFNGVDVENPQIHISTSYTMVNNMPCILISIANNGASFPKDFTIEKYIREGEFGGKNGHTGRGGYHVYQIAKRHQGYLSLGSDDRWNVKINIMIPIEYYDECETEKIVEYGEDYM